VSKPITAAQLQNPRDFQLSQIRTRFKPQEAETDGVTNLTFKLVPSDPDFPFDIEALQCVLSVPLDYPGLSRPGLRVSNKELPRGFQINVEQAFNGLVTSMPHATLLDLVKKLDRILADVLSKPMAETIKILNPVKKSIKGSGNINDSQVNMQTNLSGRQHDEDSIYTRAQISQAAEKRQADIRQLRARLGRLPGFTDNVDSKSFGLPYSVYRQDTIDLSIRDSPALTLSIPDDYNLSPCTITFQGKRVEAMSNVEAAFESQCRLMPEMALLAHVNYLSQNINTMATTPRQILQNKDIMPKPVPTKEEIRSVNNVVMKNDIDNDRKVYPMPLEWLSDYQNKTDDQDGGKEHAGSEEDEDSDDEDDYTDSEDEQGEEKESTSATEQTSKSTLAEKSIGLSFPNLEIYGIELFELQSLSLTIKCDRCKTPTDVLHIPDNPSANPSLLKQLPCKKCNNSLAVGYRKSLMHAHSVHAGFIDLDACTAVDLLPCTFIPSCSSCSASFDVGVVSVRGDSSTSTCRTCHARLSFHIHEVKFLLHSHSSQHPASNVLHRKKPKEALGLTVDTELPRRGRCKHYSKSYRWFRFSCCNKVFPCDRCHDELVDEPKHRNEFANRMICGWCSREQNYRPEDCGICHASLIGRKGRGFWEGGKGTRDKSRMSRKDPRKYKRLGGGGVAAVKKD